MPARSLTVSPRSWSSALLSRCSEISSSSFVPFTPFNRCHVCRTAAATFFDYQYLRDNPAGTHRELWYHEMGDRSWLVITRDTTSHEILAVELASDIAAAGGQS